MLWWHEDLNFWVNCNDLFVWGCADAVDITEDTVDGLELALADCEGHQDAIFLYACRHEKMRPQGAIYEHLEKRFWPLFDECGPKRETGFGNPVDRG